MHWMKSSVWSKSIAFKFHRRRLILLMSVCCPCRGPGDLIDKCRFVTSCWVSVRFRLYLVYQYFTCWISSMMHSRLLFDYIGQKYSKQMVAQLTLCEDHWRSELQNYLTEIRFADIRKPEFYDGTEEPIARGDIARWKSFLLHQNGNDSPSDTYIPWFLHTYRNSLPQQAAWSGTNNERQENASSRGPEPIWSAARWLCKRALVIFISLAYEIANCAWLQI